MLLFKEGKKIVKIILYLLERKCFFFLLSDILASACSKMNFKLCIAPMWLEICMFFLTLVLLILFLKNSLLAFSCRILLIQIQDKLICWFAFECCFGWPYRSCVRSFVLWGELVYIQVSVCVCVVCLSECVSFQNAPITN